MTEVKVRHRRTPDERAADAYRPTLKRLEAKTTKRKMAWEAAQKAEDEIRQKIAMLHQLPLPIDDERTVYVVRPEHAQDTHPVQRLALSTPAAVSEEVRAPQRFVPKPRGISECPHLKTSKVDGESRCVTCHERVYREGE